MIFGGSEEPCALANLTSLGGIYKQNNEKLSAEFAAIFSEFDVPSNRCAAAAVLQAKNNKCAHSSCGWLALGGCAAVSDVISCDLQVLLELF